MFLISKSEVFMKKLIWVILFSFIAWSCSSDLQLIKNWKELIVVSQTEKKTPKVTNVGAIMYERKISTAKRFDCIRNDEPIYFPKDLIEDLGFQSDYFIPSGQMFCNIWTYDCSSGTYYIELEKHITREEEKDDWCSSVDTLKRLISLVFLKANLQKSKNNLWVDKSNELFLIIIERGSRGEKKKYKLPNNIKLSLVINDSINVNQHSEELIFGGVQDNNLIFYYREHFLNNPNQSFYHTFYYNVEDIRKQKKIKFKDIIFEVLDFDNQSITYKIVE
ncbi:hypothetical protein D9V84_10885 [Bacteroidetes/Chlorobi group bacterium Naka2016]|jgi:hypothetical protein|nr:MAG: hypothetical protein D9V84_10885 [Bacteroidetes/Chlorobi group bacterium Naka2016]